MLGETGLIRPPTRWVSYSVWPTLPTGKCSYWALFLLQMHTTAPLLPMGSHTLGGLQQSCGAVPGHPVPQTMPSCSSLIFSFILLSASFLFSLLPSLSSPLCSSPFCSLLRSPHLCCLLSSSLFSSSLSSCTLYSPLLFCSILIFSRLSYPPLSSFPCFIPLLLSFPPLCPLPFVSLLFILFLFLFSLLLISPLIWISFFEYAQGNCPSCPPPTVKYGSPYRNE